jgi:hypothetical protein
LCWLGSADLTNGLVRVRAGDQVKKMTRRHTGRVPVLTACVSGSLRGAACVLALLTTSKNSGHRGRATYAQDQLDELLKPSPVLATSLRARARESSRRYLLGCASCALINLADSGDHGGSRSERNNGTGRVGPTIKKPAKILGSGSALRSSAQRRDTNTPGWQRSDHTAYISATRRSKPALVRYDAQPPPTECPSP